MRRRVNLIFSFLLLVASLLVLFPRLLAFTQLFFEHAGVGITQDQIAHGHAANHPNHTAQLIPRIIHRIFHDWHNESMPADWEEARQTCIDANPDWKDMLWTEETSRDFIRRSYPWFLNTYDGYRFPVQRVDATKYFLMLHYGGIYLDLDNGCLQSLEPLLYLPTWTTDGGRGALSNNILGSVPATTFWRLLTDSLIPYNYNYLFPYITISYASGQWFETAIWQTYHAVSAQGDSPLSDTNIPLHRIIMDNRPGAPPWIFFTQVRGGTWLNWDNDLFLWIGDHLVLLAVAICALVALVWRASVRWLGRGCRLRAQNYVAVSEYQTQEFPTV